MNETVRWLGFLSGRIPQCNDTNKVLPLVPVGRLGTVPPVIRAIVFDFNGVIADDETPHLLCFQQALAEAGLTLTARRLLWSVFGNGRAHLHKTPARRARRHLR